MHMRIEAAATPIAEQPMSGAIADGLISDLKMLGLFVD